METIIGNFTLLDHLGEEDTCVQLDQSREDFYNVNTSKNNSTTSSVPADEFPPGLQDFYPPSRPLEWDCEPEWHYDRATSPELPDIFLKTSKPKSKTRRGKRKNKPNASTEYKLQDIKENIKTIHASRKVSLPILNNRTRNTQPPQFFQRLPAQIYRSHRVYSLKDVQHGLKIVDSKKTMLVHLFALNTLPKDIFDDFVSSWNKLDSSVSYPPEDNTNTRGKYMALSFGCWFKPGRFLQPYMTSHYRGPGSGKHYKKISNKYYIAAKTFQNSNDRLWKFIEQLIHTHYPEIWKVYKDIQVPSGCHKFAGLFAAVIVNKYVQTEIHKDLGDIKGGICVIICWGEFNGGELVFSELLTVVPFPAGSIIVFRSAVLSHYNLPVTGDRFSMVFMTDKFLKHWSDKQTV